MQLFKHTIVIDRPRQAVFDVFVDFNRTPHWRQYVTSMQRMDEGPLGVGSRIRFTLDLMGTVTTFVMNVIAYEPATLWRHRTDETDFVGHIEYRFEPEGSGTRVTMTGVAKPRTRYGWLAMPMLWLSRNKSYREQLPRLKAAVESNG